MANTTVTPLPETALSRASLLWRPYIPYIIPAFLSYSLLCSLLRFRRRDANVKKYGFTDRKSLSRMTNVEAQEITATLAEFEFPKVYYTSIQFALFKTYGIPTISGLLAATGEFSTPENASKRYADTSILIEEFSSHHPKSERVNKALARMNFIHSRYIKAGKITQDDLLYTLSVFITEPVIWAHKYEWRDLLDMEVCAIGTFWKSIGDAMGIEYAGRLSKTEWKDGLEFYEDIRRWAEEYEEKYMVPALSNKKTADELVPLLLFYVPYFMRGPASNVVGVLMGDRLRAAMMYPTPPKLYSSVVHSVFEIRRFVLRYLSLPRPNFMSARAVADAPDPKTGRYHAKNYIAHPYYNKPGFLNRWGPVAWFVWLAGGDVPGNKGALYIPEGYIFEELGPKNVLRKGLAETAAEEERLRVERPVGCPFAFAR